MRKISTITKNINFIPVEGSEFYQDFFDSEGNVEVESVIESVYCNSIIKSTGNKADVIKKKCSKGITDGLIRFRYDGNIISFYGIQECKRNTKRNTSAYKNQISQALLYFIQTSECKVLIINSVNYFDYILIDENANLINEIKEQLLNLLDEGTPSQICKKCKYSLTDLKIHTCDVPDKAHIDKIMLEIYRNCI